MSSRYLIPLAVAAALAAPVAAHAQDEGTYDPGKWLVRVGMSQINPDSYNLDLGNGTAVVVDSDLSPTATVEYMITPHIGSRTYESVARQAKMAAENLIAVLNGKKPLAQANTL